MLGLHANIHATQLRFAGFSILQSMGILLNILYTAMHWNTQIWPHVITCKMLNSCTMGRSFPLPKINVMEKIWERKSFEVGGHWPLWQGWKNRMTMQNRHKSNDKNKKTSKPNPDQTVLDWWRITISNLMQSNFPHSTVITSTSQVTWHTRWYLLSYVNNKKTQLKHS